MQQINYNDLHKLNEAFKPFGLQVVISGFTAAPVPKTSKSSPKKVVKHSVKNVNRTEEMRVFFKKNRNKIFTTAKLVEMFNPGLEYDAAYRVVNSRIQYLYGECTIDRISVGHYRYAR